jgi:hypothetical protein
MPVNTPLDLHFALQAFGIEYEDAADVESRGQAYLLKHHVLKPAVDSVETEWSCETLNALPLSSEFRIAKPVCSTAGN